VQPALGPRPSHLIVQALCPGHARSALPAPSRRCGTVARPVLGPCCSIARTLQRSANGSLHMRLCSRLDQLMPLADFPDRRLNHDHVGDGQVALADGIGAQPRPQASSRGFPAFAEPRRRTIRLIGHIT